jgi:hypothetical protein
MKPLTTDDLYSVREYSRARPEFRSRVIAHKNSRRVSVGAHVTLHFEDRLTMQYQVQEMLRAEGITASEEIRDELDTYNALIPDGANWKATMMIEYDDVHERREALSRLKGVEDRVWAEVADHGKVWAVADEDLERANHEKTSAVHFLRFELPAEMIERVKGGAAISFGIDHPDYGYKTQLQPESRNSLAADLR